MQLPSHNIVLNFLKSRYLDSRQRTPSEAFCPTKSDDARSLDCRSRNRTCLECNSRMTCSVQRWYTKNVFTCPTLWTLGLKSHRPYVVYPPPSARVGHRNCLLTEISLVDIRTNWKVEKTRCVWVTLDWMLIQDRRKKKDFCKPRGMMTQPGVVGMSYRFGWDVACNG